MENEKENRISELGIFELRNLARDVGVKSPTTLKREELIEEINLILSGKKDKYVRKTKQGRPPKSLTNINEIMTYIIPTFKDEKPKKSLLDENLVFNDSGEEFFTNKEEILFTSIIKVFSDTYALAFIHGINENKENAIVICRNQIDDFNLKNGDVISGTYIVSNGINTLKTIYSVNGVAFDSNKVRQDFFALQAYIADKKIKTNVYREDDQIFKDIDIFSPIAKGQRVLIKSKTQEFNLDILSRLANDSNKLSGIILMFDESPEDFYALNNKYTNFEVVSNNFNTLNENISLKLDCKINNLLRKVENGENVVLYVCDIVKLYQYYVNSNILLNQSSQEAKINASNQVKNLILLGKNSREKGSLTIICNFNETATNELNDSEKYVFKNLFNNIIVLNMVKHDFVLNKTECETKNLEKILTKTEYEIFKSNI